jgi:hypothetical protein
VPQFQGRPELFGQGGNEVLNRDGQEAAFSFNGEVVLTIWPGKKGFSVI